MLHLPTYAPNYLINAGFDFSQLTAPATATTISDASLTHPDGWKVFGENASVQYRRYKRGDSGSSFTGLTSRSYGRFSKITNAGQLAFAQIVEAIDTYPLVGRLVRFQIKLRADSSRTFKIGLLEWQGTIDSLTSDIVSSWADPPTWATSYSLLSSASCSVTTSFQSFGVTGTVSSSCANLLAVVWSSADVTATTGYVEAAEAGLHVGSQPRNWQPDPVQQEFDRCLRRIECSYPLDTAPGSTGGEYGAAGCERGPVVGPSGYWFMGGNVSFKVPKLKIPTMTIYSPVTGASGMLRLENFGVTPADKVANASAIGTGGLTILGNSDLVENDTACAQWVANANL